MATTRKTQKNMTTSPVDFEKALTELNQLIAQMETGEQSLESSLQCFEKGIALIKHCQQTLNAAEQTVQRLTVKDDRP